MNMDDEQIKIEDRVEEEEMELTEEMEPSEDILSKIGGFFAFLGRTTVQYFKNLPNSIRNKVKAKIAEYRRMPKRKSIHKVYVLVGYTTKEYVDNKFRKERSLLIIRRVLIGCIIVIVLIMAYRWFVPKLDTNEYKQMIGINEFDELTQSDPFATETTNEAVVPDIQNVTPIPSSTAELNPSDETKTTETTQEVV